MEVTVLDSFHPLAVAVQASLVVVLESSEVGSYLDPSFPGAFGFDRISIAVVGHLGDFVGFHHGYFVRLFRVLFRILCYHLGRRLSCSSSRHSSNHLGFVHCMAIVHPFACHLVHKIDLVCFET